MMGLGAFPLVRLPGILVDTFHCPVLESAVRAGASTIAGLAMRVGDDKVVVRGSEVKVNGHHLETSGTFGGLLLNTSNTSVVAKYEDLQLSSMVHRGAHSATGYLMNVQLETHSQPMSSGNASICGVNAGRQQIPQLGPLETLFDADDYAVRHFEARPPPTPSNSPCDTSDVPLGCPLMAGTRSTVRHAGGQRQREDLPRASASQPEDVRRGRHRPSRGEGGL